MSVNLKKLSSGHLSLEFDLEDIPLVAQAIRDTWEKPKRRQHIGLDLYYFRGCEFIYLSEWDQPCLISQSEAGNDVLQELYTVASNESAS